MDRVLSWLKLHDNRPGYAEKRKTRRGTRGGGGLGVRRGGGGGWGEAGICWEIIKKKNVCERREKNKYEGKQAALGGPRRNEFQISSSLEE